MNSNGSGIIHCFTSPNCSSPLAPGNYLAALLSFVDGKLGNCQVKGKIVEIPPGKCVVMKVHVHKVIY